MKSQFKKNGFAVLQEVVSPVDCDELSAEFESLFPSSMISTAGVRDLFRQSSAVCQLVRQASIRNLVELILGEDVFAVRAILFDKTPEANWYVTWHQDTFIAVKEHHNVDGYDAWSVKEGIPHVKPPASVLASMMTLRLHLDPCGIGNGPLHVLPASHESGFLTPSDVASKVAGVEEVVCSVGRGDCVLMSPLLLHASSRATQPTRRRVLHIEFANCDLPLPLEWYERF